MEVELSKVLPANAIVTPIEPANPDHKPRNWDGFTNHMSYLAVARRLDLSSVRSYVFVRHPYEVMLSHFFLVLTYLEQRSDWQNEVDNYLSDKLAVPHLGSGRGLYTMDDEVCVTEVLFYERGIEAEINRILPLSGIGTIKIATFEKAFRPRQLMHTDVFEERHLELIRHEWAWEFSKFGYRK